YSRRENRSAPLGSLLTLPPTPLARSPNRSPDRGRQPRCIGQRLADALRLGHCRKERESTILIGMVERGELLGVVQGGHDLLSIRRQIGLDMRWNKARHGDLQPEDARRARGQTVGDTATSGATPARNDKRGTRKRHPTAIAECRRSRRDSW